MDDRQLYGLFAIPRHPDGTPNLRHPFNDDMPSEEAGFKRFLFLNGITDREKQEELWKVERKRRGRPS